MRRRTVVGLTASTLMGAVFLVAMMPVATRQGINYEVSTHHVPLHQKVFDFVYRSNHYQLLADEATLGTSTDQERVLAVFDWTQRNIPRTPKGWTVVDDHILNIIIRGHGTADQRADVFTTLSTYAGVPAFWAKVRLQKSQDGIILSFALVDGRWVVFDVANGVVFRNDRGDLATPADLRNRRDLIPSRVHDLKVGGTPYPRFLEHLQRPPVPNPLRAELQMSGQRFRYELGRVLSVGESDGFQR